MFSGTGKLLILAHLDTNEKAPFLREGFQLPGVRWQESSQGPSLFRRPSCHWAVLPGEGWGTPPEALATMRIPGLSPKLNSPTAKYGAQMSEPEINSCSWFSHLLQVRKHSRRRFQKISRPLSHVTSLQTLLKLGPHSGESRLLWESTGSFDPSSFHLGLSVLFHSWTGGVK